jgi:acyl carrier protein
MQAPSRIPTFKTVALSAMAAGSLWHHAVTPSPIPAATSASPVLNRPMMVVDGSVIKAQVQKLVKKMLGIEVTPDQPLMEAGLDSLSAVELKTELESVFTMELPATVTFDFPTIEGLVRFITSQKQEEAEEKASNQQPPAAQQQHHQQVTPLSFSAAAGPSRSVPASPAVVLADVAATISKAVHKMLGVVVDGEQPLMEAGLDSLSKFSRKLRINWMPHSALKQCTHTRPLGVWLPAHHLVLHTCVCRCCGAEDYTGRCL